MSRALVGIVALSLVATGGCTRTTLRAFQGRAIQQTPTEPLEGRSRGLQTGHLLGPSEGLVLAVVQHDPGNVVVDDEKCSIVLVEIPGGGRDDVPTVIETPRAYLRQWGCTWGLVREERVIGGRVEIRRRESGSVQAQLDLQFRDRRVRKSGSFILSEPESFLRAPTMGSGESSDGGQ